MKTIAFIGSDKNAGKTTALNHVYAEMVQHGNDDHPLCVSSIGINGEDVDFFTGLDKPAIHLKQGSYFITTAAHLDKHQGRFSDLRHFSGSKYSNDYVLGRCERNMHLIIEGPNSRNEILALKHGLAQLLPDATLLIDGSIDRCFLASPEISDAFYFSLYLSAHPEQLVKAHDLLFPLSLPSCSKQQARLIARHRRADTKALYFGESDELLYHGTRIPFLDDALKACCREHAQQHGLLYLNGALSRSLYRFLAPFDRLALVLDNFFLYQNIYPDQDSATTFAPRMSLYHAPHVLGIFLRRDEGTKASLAVIKAALPFPGQVPIRDLSQGL